MRIDDVWVRYGRRGPWVLRGVRAEVGPGEAVILNGRNGAGKSTLLQVAAGVLTPDRGRVVDRPARVGWVPEKFPAEQPFTVTAYLTGMARVGGLGAGAVAGAVGEWVERLGLVPFRDVRLGELSKGTAQKVGLAQAMIGRPALLILDEPWEGLDQATRDLVPDIVREVTGRGGRVLISDHRGDTVALPEATAWSLADGVTTAGRGGADRRCIVEVAVPVSTVDDVVAGWRAAGHDVVRIRDAAGAVVR